MNSVFIVNNVFIAFESNNVIQPKFFDYKIDAYEYLDAEIKKWNEIHRTNLKTNKTVKEMSIAEALNFLMAWSNS